MQPVQSLFLPSETDTTRLGHDLAARLGPGDTLLLEGAIGAGKTHLARAIISQLLKVAEDIPSPTYTLVQTYDGRELSIWHADLYRLGDSSELVELGLTEAIGTALVLIEWPDRMPTDLVPPSALRIELAVDDDGRRVTFVGSDDWHGRLAELSDA